MKALKLTFEHGRIWTVETSDGKRSQAASMSGALEKLLPASLKDAPEEQIVKAVFDGIRDSGNTSNIARGQASG